MQIIPISSEKIHPLAVKICQTLHNNNYQAFIVGGCVRDLLLGYHPNDWDITTNASPEKVAEIFPRTIPTGLEHGTITVCMDEGEKNHFEVTTFRTEGKYLDGRRPESVSFVQDIKEDLARRDLTINAMAYDPINNQLTDPFDGVLAIEHRMLHAVGDPATRFQEDGLRIMRVARFAARFGWSISSVTEDGMKVSLDTLKKVSKERVSDELSKILMSSHPSYGLNVLKECGALDIACPLLAGRMLPALDRQDQCPGVLETRLALLYIRLPVKEVEKELMGLKFSNKEVKRVIFLRNLMTKFWELHFSAEWDVPGYRNFIAYMKNDGADTYEYVQNEFIALLDALGEGIDTLEAYEKVCPLVLSRKEMAINGDDLIEAGFKPGPKIKTILDGCYREILNYPENNNKDYLINLVKNPDLY